MEIRNGILYGVNDEDINADGSFIFPNSVTSIGDYAFAHCHYLTYVTIPNSVKSIGDSAFCECFNLVSPPKHYKAFRIAKSGALMCLDKHYQVGKKSTVRGDLKLCRNGIHYCTNLFDIFNYYSGEYGKDFVIGLCDVSNENIVGGEDSKHCARWIIPTKILTREEVIRILNGEDEGIGV